MHTWRSNWREGDIRRKYFEGDRLDRTVRRIEKINQTIGNEEPNVVTAALKFALKAPVSTVIPGIRDRRQAEMNCGEIGDAEPMSGELERKLRQHYWRRGFWYTGK